VHRAGRAPRRACLINADTIGTPASASLNSIGVVTVLSRCSLAVVQPQHANPVRTVPLLDPPIRFHRVARGETQRRECFFPTIRPVPFKGQVGRNRATITPGYAFRFLSVLIRRARATLLHLGSLHRRRPARLVNASEQDLGRHLQPFAAANGDNAQPLLYRSKVHPHGPGPLVHSGKPRRNHRVAQVGFADAHWELHRSSACSTTA
jgi:hypothetical protein